jgi:hypothetical protein
MREGLPSPALDWRAFDSSAANASHAYATLRTILQFPWLTLAGAASALAIFAAPGAADALGYRVYAPHAWWSGFACHWVHWNGEHLFWSLGTFVVLGALCEWRSRRLFAACVLISAAAIPLALRVIQPAYALYGGLSGIDFGLFALLCGTETREAVWERRWAWAATGAVLLLAGLAKLTYELTSGALLFVSVSAELAPAPAAHAVAGAAGLLLASPPFTHCGIGPGGWEGRAASPARGQFSPRRSATSS